MKSIKWLVVMMIALCSANGLMAQMEKTVAFSMLPTGTVDMLLKPENKTKLSGILTYHVVSGKLDSKELTRLIKEGNGTAGLTTVEGGKLWVMMKGKNIVLKDEKGNMAMVTIMDVYQSNGVIHVIDHVVMPKS